MLTHTIPVKWNWQSLKVYTVAKSASITMHTQENRRKKFFYYRGLSQPTAAPFSCHLAVQSVPWPKIPFWMQQNHQQFQKMSDKAPLPQQEWLETTPFSKPRESLWQEMWCNRGLRCDVVLSTSVSGNSHFLTPHYSSPDPVPLLSRRDLGDWRGDLFGDRFISLGSQS